MIIALVTFVIGIVLGFSVRRPRSNVMQNTNAKINPPVHQPDNSKNIEVHKQQNLSELSELKNELRQLRRAVEHQHKESDWGWWEGGA